MTSAIDTKTKKPQVKKMTNFNLQNEIPVQMVRCSHFDNSSRLKDFIFFTFMSLIVGFTCGIMLMKNIDFSEIEYLELVDSYYEPIKITNTGLYAAQLYTPEQIHLSLGANSSEIYVTWSTQAPIKCNLIYCKSLDGKTCSQQEQVVPGILKETSITESDYKRVRVTRRHRRILYSYRAKMSNIMLNSLAENIYLYRVVSQGQAHIDGFSKMQTRVFSSNTYQYIARNLTDPNRRLRLAFYGDLGLDNGQSIPRLIQDVDDDKYDAIIHNGDFAYDLNTHLGQVGDEFMRKIEPIAARVPYQTSVGNHEVHQNFSHYDHRFTMIDSGDPSDPKQNNFYYSFNLGPIHFVAFSTEFYYFLDYSGIAPLQNQYDWLKKDLERASTPQERAIRPWIVVFAHRPMYCSSRDNDDCTKGNNIVRKGLPFIGAYALEKLFYDFGVDVELYSHEHQYERFLPIYDSVVYNGTDNPQDPYYNARAPVHLISGSAGCQERLDPFVNHTAPGSIKQISDYGFTRITADRCSIKFEQISDDQTGSVVDEFIISKIKQNFPESHSEIIFDCSLDTFAAR